ncbi:MAG TPA: glycosyltransferase [Proteobacteria bacterium]|nr:glycosyltransferase [Pseudomonadota bacterium]
MKVAIITEFLPWPLDNAPKIRLFEELKVLADGNFIDLFCFLPPDAERGWVDEVESLGVRVFAVPLRTGRMGSLRLKVKALVSGRPYYISKWFDGSLHDLFTDRLRSEAYDLIHVDLMQMAGYVPRERRGNSLLVMHNLEHVLLERYARVAPLWMRPAIKRESKVVRKLEAELCSDFGWIVCMTHLDRARIAEHAPGSTSRTVAIPTCVDTEYFKPEGEDKSATPAVAMTGDFRWLPTRDGLMWFLGEVFPRMVEVDPDLCFYVIGPVRAKDTRSISDERIVFTGLVGDVRPYLERCWLFVNPMRAAAGIRTRLLHALAMGLCAVSTSVGFEGLDESLRRFIWCEDAAESFAERCLTLLRDRELLESRGREARELVGKLYGLDRFRATWLDLYETIQRRLA